MKEIPALPVSRVGLIRALPRPSLTACRKVLLPGAAFLALSVLSACHRNPPAGTIAVVGNEPISKTEIQSAISRMHLPNGVPDSVPSDILNRLIERRLIDQEAQTEGLAQEPKIRKTIQESREKILRHTLIERQVDSKVKVTDADIKAYFDKHRAEIKQPGFVVVRQLILPDAATAKTISPLIHKKKGFGKAIDRYKGGSVGKIFEGTVPPQFVAFFFNLPQGSVTGPLVLKDGVHYFKIDQAQPGVLLNFDQAKSGISQYLKSRQKQDRYQAFLNSLRAKTKIEINQKALGALFTSLSPPKQGQTPAPGPATGK